MIVGVSSAMDLNKAGSPSGHTSYIMRADQYYGWIEQTAQGDLYKGGPWDTSDPTVAIVSPAADAEVDPSFTVSATATDDTGIKQVRALVDGEVVGQGASGPFQFEVQGQAAGKHTIEVEATDAVAKTVVVSISVTVKQPDQPPSPGETPPSASGGEASPGGGRGYGEPCTVSRDCQSNLCALDPVSGVTFCTRSCDLDSASCPGGAICHPGSADTSSVSICGRLPSDGNVVVLVGACSFAGTASDAPTPLVLALLGLALGLRRRASARRQQG